MMDDSSSDPPIRSKYRGLSWDKKYQGWRVRIYYYGKQRHVGRFEDEISAAKAYDKAAWYLYGANAITNFGFEECQKDPTGVSSFIIQAKEKADQEQSCRLVQVQQQQLPYGLSPEGRTGMQTVLHNGSVQPTQQQQQQQQQLYQQSVQQQQQQQLLSNQLDDAAALTAWQQQQQQLCSMTASPAAAAYTASSALLSNGMQNVQDQYASSLAQQQLMLGSGSLQQQQQQQRAVATSLGGSSQLYGVAPSQTQLDDSSRSNSLATSSMSNSSSTLSSTSSTGAYMLCSTANGQTVVLPLPPAAVAAAVAAAGYAPTDAANFMLPLQQQQQQPSQQQQQLVFMNGSGCAQPLLLSIDAQHTSIAGHMAAAAAAATAADGSTCSSPTQQQQQLLQQQLQSLSMLDQPLGSFTSSMRNASSTSNSLLCSPYAAGQVGLQQQAVSLQPHQAVGGDAAAAPACAAYLEADTMQRLFPGYAAAAAAATAAPAAGSSSGSLLPLQQQQLLSARLQGSTGSSGGAFGECGSSSSSSGSPMLLCAAPAPAAGQCLSPHPYGVSALMTSKPIVGTSNRSTCVVAAGSGAAAHMVSSPTHSSCSSGGSYSGRSQPFGLQGMMLC